MQVYTVVLSPNEYKGLWSVTCPAMPGAASCGFGREEALRNIAEAMGGWFEVSQERGYRPLEETPDLIADEIRLVLSDRLEEGLDLVVEVARVSPELAVVVG